MTNKTLNLISIISALTLIIFVIGPVFSSGDNTAASIDGFANTADVAATKQLVADIAARNFDTIIKKAEPECASPELPATLGKTADIFPAEQAKDVKTVGYNYTKMVGTAGTTETVYVMLEYQFSKQWIVADMTLRKKDEGEARIVGLHVVPQTDSLENLTRFNFSGQDPLHYVVFAFAVGVTLFDAWVLAQCVRTPIPKRKWLWIAFVLAGFGGFQYNWITGVFQFSALIGHLPVVQFAHATYHPLFIEVMLPVGAFFFLFRRKKWLANSNSTQPTSPTPVT